MIIHRVIQMTRAKVSQMGIQEILIVLLEAEEMVTIINVPE